MADRVSRGAGGSSRWAGVLAWLSNHELTPLIAIILVTGGLFVFGSVASEVMEGDTTRFDRAILLAMRNPADLSDPIGPPSVEEMARDFTAMGGVAIVTFVTLAVAGYLFLIQK